MIILFACLGSFVAGVAVGMLIASYRWGKTNMQFAEVLNRTAEIIEKDT